MHALISVKCTNVHWTEHQAVAEYCPTHTEGNCTELSILTKLNELGIWEAKHFLQDKLLKNGLKLHKQSWPTTLKHTERSACWIPLSSPAPLHSPPNSFDSLITRQTLKKLLPLTGKSYIKHCPVVPYHAWDHETCHSKERESPT